MLWIIRRCGAICQIKQHFVKITHTRLRWQHVNTQLANAFKVSCIVAPHSQTQHKPSTGSSLLMDKLTSGRCPAIPQRWQCWFHRGGLSQSLRPCEGRPQLWQGRLGQSLWMWPWIPQRMQVGHFCWCLESFVKKVKFWSGFGFSQHGTIKPLSLRLWCNTTRVLEDYWVSYSVREKNIRSATCFSFIFQPHSITSQDREIFHV